ncbi:MAG TPA: zinc ribbon domain-containing protein [Candidatus Methanomethylicus sp.]|nr:zinc ribbon domain-containing protein [Candidatus Methanomethylicus sp.]
MPYCPNCGKQIEPDANFCISCGAQMKPVTAPQASEELPLPPPPPDYVVPVEGSAAAPQTQIEPATAGRDPVHVWRGGADSGSDTQREEDEVDGEV